MFQRQFISSRSPKMQKYSTTYIDNPNKKHFCIFDELYSGTNPYEAISSAYSYLKFIAKNKNVKFLLTTHYLKLCDLLKTNKKILNQSMETNIVNNNPYI